MEQQTDEQEKEAKLQAFFEKARKGVLAYLNQQGGTLNLGEMHDFSLKTFFIQHQRFSIMMETFVDNDLVDYDPIEQRATITEKGKSFIAE